MITTHVLDTSRGRPAGGVRVDFAEVRADGATRPLKSVVTDADGRARLLDEGELRVGRFELTFHGRTQVFGEPFSVWCRLFNGGHRSGQDGTYIIFACGVRAVGHCLAVDRYSPIDQLHQFKPDR